MLTLTRAPPAAAPVAAAAAAPAAKPAAANTKSTNAATTTGGASNAAVTREDLEKFKKEVFEYIDKAKLEILNAIHSKK